MRTETQEAWQLFRANPGQETFLPFYEATKGLTFTICRRILRDPEDAADAFQSAYCRLLAKDCEEDFSDLENDAERLIRRLAAREANNLRKRRARRARREIAMPTNSEKPHGGKGPDEEAADREIRQRVETLVLTLPERYQAPILLHYFHGMTQTDIADSLGAPVRTISGRIERGLKRLRPLMRRAGLGEVLSAGGLALGVEILSPPASLSAASIFAQSQVFVGTVAVSTAVPLSKLLLGGAFVKAKIAVVGVIVIVIGLGFLGPKLREEKSDTETQSIAPEINSKAPGVVEASPATTKTLVVAQPPAPPRPVDNKGASLTGKVTDLAGAPISGATVYSIMPTINARSLAPVKGAPITTSAEDGSYHLREWKPCYIMIFATHPEYSSARAEFLMVEKDSKLKLDFVLGKAYSIEGRVVQKFNGVDRAVSGLLIMASVNGGNFGASGKASSFSSAVTDEDGAFLASGLLFDTAYAFRALISDDLRFRVPPVQVASGESPAPLLIRLPDAGSILGVVRDAAGLPVENAKVILTQYQFPGMGSSSSRLGYLDPRNVVTDAEGRFEIEGTIMKGTYDLKAEAEGFEPGVVSRANSLGQDVVIVLAEKSIPGILRGRVFDAATGANVAGLEVKVLKNFPKGTMQYIIKKSLKSALSKGDGSFEIVDIPPGNYAITGRTPLGAKGDTWVLRPTEKIKIEAGSVKAGVELAAVKGATIHGRILMSPGLTPVENATLYINSEIYKTEDGKTFNTKPDGEFAITGLLPGPYRIAAKKSGLIEVNIDGTMRQDSEKTDPIILQEGETVENIELFLSEEGVIEGTVLDPDGEPAPDMWIIPEWKIEVGENIRNPYFTLFSKFRAQTGPDGRFRITGLPFGNQKKRIILSQRSKHAMCFTEYVQLTRENPRAKVRLQMVRGGSISGIATDEAGKPLAGESFIATRHPGSSLHSPWKKFAETDQNGRYELKNLHKGVYKIFYRGSSDYIQTEILDIEVKAGETTENINVVLKKKSKEGEITLRGVVSDLAMNRLSDCEVRGETRGAKNRTFFPQQTALDGSFKIERMTLGDKCFFRFYVKTPSMESLRFKSGLFEVVEEEQFFVLPFGGKIRGRLIAGEGGSPVKGGTILLDGKFSDPARQGVDCGVDSYIFDTKNPIRTDEQGRFDIPELPLGDQYKLTIRSDSAAEKVLNNVSLGADLLTDLGDIVLEMAGEVVVNLKDSRTGKPFFQDAQNTLTASALLKNGESVSLLVRQGQSSGNFILGGVPLGAERIILEFSRHLTLEILAPESLKENGTGNLGSFDLAPEQTARGILKGPKK